MKKTQGDNLVMGCAPISAHLFLLPAFTTQGIETGCGNNGIGHFREISIREHFPSNRHLIGKMKGLL